MPELSRCRYLVFTAIPSVLCGLLLVGAYFYLTSDDRARQRGQRINREAWELAYSERGLPVPEAGPRTGLWGARLKPKVEAVGVAWHEPQIQLDALLDIDAEGLQHYVSLEADPARVFILGGSVAFGSYSSRIDTTYFFLLAQELEAAGTPAHIDVFAGGAWKAVQEVRALEQQIGRLEPDVVVLFDGLNELTVGSNSGALFGEPTPTRDGREWHPLYHEHDYSQRVTDYLARIRDASRIVRDHGARLLVVLQPSLIERGTPSEIERELLVLSLQWHESARALTDSYEAMRQGLLGLEREGALTFLDASRVFDGEEATVFADLWHYGDAGHRLIAARMLAPISSMLQAALPPAPGGPG
ncbi:MAG: SGNH/GDSL hydrolase family protein [Deltaproteobacteria bacterium]|nr:SGNH/GDSL hydrolase family protein [Deltaproteobacteria bacterium]